MNLSIVIVTKNARDLLLRCIDSICANADCSGLEIIVVDNASSDGSSQAVRDKYRNVVLLENSTNEFFSRANNKGIVFSSRKFVLLLNNDTEIVGDALLTMLHFLESNAAIGAVCGRLMNYDNTQQIGFNIRRFPTALDLIGQILLLHKIPGLDKMFRRFFCLTIDYDQVQHVEQPAASCWMIRKEVFDTIGLLDESLDLYFNDVDFCKRMASHDIEFVYLPDVRVYHRGAHSVNILSSAELTSHYYRNLLSYCRKYFNAMEISAIRASIFLGAIERFVLALPLSLLPGKILRKTRSFGAVSTVGEALETVLTMAKSAFLQ